MSVLLRLRPTPRRTELDHLPQGHARLRERRIVRDLTSQPAQATASTLPNAPCIPARRDSPRSRGDVGASRGDGGQQGGHVRIGEAEDHASCDEIGLQEQLASLCRRNLASGDNRLAMKVRSRSSGRLSTLASRLVSPSISHVNWDGRRPCAYRVDTDSQ